MNNAKYYLAALPATHFETLEKLYKMSWKINKIFNVALENKERTSEARFY